MLGASRGCRGVLWWKEHRENVEFGWLTSLERGFDTAHTWLYRTPL